MFLFRKKGKDEKLRSLFYLLSRLGYHISGPSSVSFVDASSRVNYPTTSIAVGWMHHSRVDDGTGRAGVKAFAVEIFSDVAAVHHEISIFGVEKRKLVAAASEILGERLIDGFLDPQKTILDAAFLGVRSGAASATDFAVRLDCGEISQSEFSFEMCGAYLRQVRSDLDLYNDGDLTFREFLDIIENPKLK